MKLEDIIDLLNDSSIINIYDNEQNLVATYDGKESIPEFMNYRFINDIFPDIHLGKCAIGIELNMTM